MNLGFNLNTSFCLLPTAYCLLLLVLADRLHLIEALATRTIVVAKEPLRFGTEISASMLQEVPWPAESQPSGANGGVAFFGYSEDFIWPTALPDYYFECDSKIDRAFADGLTAAKVYECVAALVKKRAADNRRERP